MADEAPAESLVEYQLVTDKGETKNTSKEYTGKGTATYPNGDVYIGDFVDGVSSLLIILITVIIDPTIIKWNLHLCF